MTWFNLSPATLTATQSFVQENVERYAGHWIWDPIVQWILMMPSWAFLGILGGILAYVGRKRRLAAAYA